jgi:hypothetical protein
MLFFGLNSSIMRFASPLRNWPSLGVGLQSLTNSFPHFWSIVVISVCENERYLPAASTASRKPVNLTPGFSSEEILVAHLIGLRGVLTELLMVVLPLEARFGPGEAGVLERECAATGG